MPLKVIFVVVVVSKRQEKKSNQIKEITEKWRNLGKTNNLISEVQETVDSNKNRRQNTTITKNK